MLCKNTTEIFILIKTWFIAWRNIFNSVQKKVNCIVYNQDYIFAIGLRVYSLGKIISFTVSILSLPTLGHALWDFPFHVSIGGIPFQTMFMKPCWFHECCFADLPMRYCVTESFLFLWFLQWFHFFLLEWSMNVKWKSCSRCVSVNSAPYENSAFWQVVYYVTFFPQTHRNFYMSWLYIWINKS